MGGASALTIDRVINEGINGDGFRGCLPLMLDAAGVGTGPLTASTAPEKIAWATDLEAIKWDNGDGATAVVRWSFRMPFDYDPLAKNGSGNTDDMFVEVYARKLDSGSDENADLALLAQVTWITPGTDTSNNQLTTAASATLAASNNTTAPGGIAKYTLDIGARLRAEGKRIDAGDIVTLAIGPHETVGSGDMDLEALVPSLIYRRHAAFTDTTRR